MAEQKTRNPRFVTPKGELVYPYLTEPDTKFNANGDYKSEIKLPENAEMIDSKGKNRGKIVDFLNQSIDDAVEKFGEEHNGKKKKGKTIEVTEADDPPLYIDDGTLFVKFKLKAYVEPQNGESFTQAPVLFDSKGKKANLKQNPWNGTIAKINFEVVPYYNAKDAQAGITLRLKAAQIIDPVFGGSANGEDFGFGEEEGGFEAGDEPDAPEGNDEGFSDEGDGFDGDDDHDDAEDF
jgi:hypothetical protein